ncbi:hypothetical protein FDF26_14075 [Clostridium botulinum]|uniref:hypothetical protein n=1 Tax=Clostridium sp. M14 TaxID=2716311 RepID=UPI0013EE517E|nr:hypothetical protein [Clostridium sp. M14]MBZ9693199.1 hypothetical protein [Clostridium sp. M14]NFT08169.1 hypothetical protein [Clostridium botulinum]
MVKLIKKSIITLMLGITLLSNVSIAVNARSLDDDNWDKAYGWTYSKEASKWTYYEDGKMKIGWLNQGGTWYYFGLDGIMAKGIQCIDGKWYYFRETGVMVKDCTLSGMTFDSNGVMIF